MAAGQPAGRKGEIVTTGFVRDAEIGTGTAPLRPMGREAAAAGSKLSEKMGQLVAQGAIHFRLSMRAEAAIEQDARGSIFGSARRGAQAGRPFDYDTRGEIGRALLLKKLARQRFKRRIATGRTRREGRGER